MRPIICLELHCTLAVESQSMTLESAQRFLRSELDPEMYRTIGTLKRAFVSEDAKECEACIPGHLQNGKCKDDKVSFVCCPFGSSSKSQIQASGTLLNARP